LQFVGIWLGLESLDSNTCTSKATRFFVCNDRRGQPAGLHAVLETSPRKRLAEREAALFRAGTNRSQFCIVGVVGHHNYAVCVYWDGNFRSITGTAFDGNGRLRCTGVHQNCCNRCKQYAGLGYIFARY